ncbi:MAG: response regulator transcription factor, partial [Desulfatitalea sp.]|nr:response regulator transcription factor [Desulfatitalea sp.]
MGADRKDNSKDCKRLDALFYTTFTLPPGAPWCRLGPLKANPRRKEPRLKHPKARILVVEDDPAILHGLQDLLVFNGYAADGAADGGQGLAAAQSGGYDLVLLDVMLPTLDGFSICNRLRRERPAQAIIMLTAKGAEEDVVAGFKAGADDYVSKPFSLRELMVRVEAVLRRSGKPLGDECVQYKDMQFDGRNLRASRGGQAQELT